MNQLPGERHPEDKIIIGWLFNAPLTCKGLSWIPVTQLVTWLVMTWLAKKRLPERSWTQSLGVGALTMPVVLGSEWCHNLAHAAAADWIGKPVDAIRVILGMPRLVYYDLNDESVTPRQHIIRALGGPLVNLLILPFAVLLKSCSKPESASRDIANAAVATNAFLPTMGMLPIPGIDGGAVLKWSLVEKGKTIHEADNTVRKVDGVLGGLFSIAGIVCLKKHRWIVGGVILQFAALALGVALGIIKEQTT
jgi:Zn-dependent protease